MCNLMMLRLKVFNATSVELRMNPTKMLWTISADESYNVAVLIAGTQTIIMIIILNPIE